MRRFLRRFWNTSLYFLTFRNGFHHFRKVLSFFGMLLSGSKGFAHAPGMVFKIIVGWGFHPNVSCGSSMVRAPFSLAVGHGASTRSFSFLRKLKITVGWGFTPTFLKESAYFGQTKQFIAVKSLNPAARWITNFDLFLTNGVVQSNVKFFKFEKSRRVLFYIIVD